LNVCVTGGSGFIGSYFSQRLRADGHHVTILDLVDPPEGTACDRFVKGDLRDPKACAAAVRNCARVIHLAAAHHDFGIPESTFYAVNEDGARVLSAAMDDASITDLCYYSSVAVYGDAPGELDEAKTPQPNSPYGGSKLKGERVLKEWTEKGGGRRCLVIRPTVTFGPRNFANMYSLIRQIYTKKFLFVGDGSNIKSLSYVENIVDATFYLLALENRPPFDLYNYVEKPDFTSRQISLAIFDSLGRRAPRFHIPMWLARLAALPFDAVIALTGKNLPVSGARIQKLFATQTKFEADKVRRAGFVPKVALGEGILRMVRWYEVEGRHLEAKWNLPPDAVAPLLTADA